MPNKQFDALPPDETDLYLNYEFTDRGSKRVFGVYLAADSKTLLYRLGEVRLSADDLEIPQA
jgi:hypothetical protein